MANEDKATRYHRLQRRASILSTVTAALFLLLLIVSGGSSVIRTWLSHYTMSIPLLVFGYVITTFVLHEAIQLPFAFYQGVTLEHRYGLSTESRRHWWVNHFKA